MPITGAKRELRFITMRRSDRQRDRHDRGTRGEDDRAWDGGKEGRVGGQADQKVVQAEEARRAWAEELDPEERHAEDRQDRRDEEEPDQERRQG